MGGVKRPNLTGDRDTKDRPIRVSDQVAANRADAPQPPVEPDVQEWLRGFQVIGFSREEIMVGDGVVPGGCCANCGAGIINVVTAHNPTTGRTVKLGMDCAERVGLSKEQIQSRMREKYASDRFAAWGADRVRRETELTALHGGSSHRSTHVQRKVARSPTSM